MKLDLMTLEGKASGSVTLPKEVFGLEVRKDLLHRAVQWQLARRRSGTASTQVVGEVSRTGSKLYRQKGMGKARHNSRRVNTFVGGSVAFGPRPRSFAFSMPKKVRALAIKTAFSSKAAEKNIVVIEDTKIKSHKTKDLASTLEKMNLTRSLFVVDSMDENFDKASRNLPFVRVVPTEGANVYDILKAEKVVLTKQAVDMLKTRLSERHTKKEA